MFLTETRTWVRLAAVVAVLALVPALTACGDSDDDNGSGSGGNATAASDDANGGGASGGGAKPASSGEAAEIEDAVLTYQKAGLDGDAKTVCASFTDEYRKSLVKQAKGEPCEKSFKEILKNRIKGTVPKITAVKITGDSTAKVSYDGGGVSGKVDVVKEDGEWKMDLGKLETVLAGPGVGGGPEGKP